MLELVRDADAEEEFGGSGRRDVEARAAAAGVVAEAASNSARRLAGRTVFRACIQSRRSTLESENMKINQNMTSGVSNIRIKVNLFKFIGHYRMASQEANCRCIVVKRAPLDRCFAVSQVTMTPAA